MLLEDVLLTRDPSTFDLKATTGQQNWATIASLVETCKLNAVDPQTYLTATLTANRRCRGVRADSENEFEKGAPDQGQTPFSC